MTEIRIFADFNNCDQHYRVRLNTVRSLRDIAALIPPLVEGAVVTLADGDGEFEVEAKASFTGAIWVATPLWETRRILCEDPKARQPAHPRN